MKAITFLGYGVAVAMLTLAGPARASAEGGVAFHFQEVVVKTDEAGYGFRFSVDKEGDLARVQVEWGGKTFDFSPKHFGKVEDVCVGRVRIVAPTSQSLGKQDEVILVLPYDPGHVEVGDKLRQQWNAIRLSFDKGQLVMWERAKAIESQPGKWQLTSWGEIEGDKINEKGEVEGKILDQGIETEEENPYAPNVFPQDDE